MIATDGIFNRWRDCRSKIYRDLPMNLVLVMVDDSHAVGFVVHKVAEPMNIVM